MCKRPMSTMTGEAAGNREPMTTQHISAAQRTRMRARRVSGGRPNRGVGLFCCRSMLSINCRLFRLGGPACLQTFSGFIPEQIREGHPDRTRSRRGLAFRFGAARLPLPASIYDCLVRAPEVGNYHNERIVHMLSCLRKSVKSTSGRSEWASLYDAFQQVSAGAIVEHDLLERQDQTADIPRRAGFPQAIEPRQHVAFRHAVAYENADLLMSSGRGVLEHGAQL